MSASSVTVTLTPTALAPAVAALSCGRILNVSPSYRGTFAALALVGRQPSPGITVCERGRHAPRARRCMSILLFAVVRAVACEATALLTIKEGKNGAIGFVLPSFGVCRAGVGPNHGNAAAEGDLFANWH